MLNLMEGIIPEFDRKGVVRGPSGSSVTGIVSIGAYPCAPAPGAAPNSTLDYVIISANADSMHDVHDRGIRLDERSVCKEPPPRRAACRDRGCDSGVDERALPRGHAEHARPDRDACWARRECARYRHE